MVPKQIVRSRLGSSIPVPKQKFDINRSTFCFVSKSSIVEKTIRFFELEAEVPNRIANSNFCYSIWKPKRILEVDFRFSFWSGSSKTNSGKSTPVNDNWFWSGDGERMAEKYTEQTSSVVDVGMAYYISTNTQTRWISTKVTGSLAVLTGILWMVTGCHPVSSSKYIMCIGCDHPLPLHINVHVHSPAASKIH